MELLGVAALVFTAWLTWPVGLWFGGSVMVAAMLHAMAAGEGADRSLKEGGWQIEYEDEDPEIRRRFKEALRGSGVPFTMPEINS